MTPDEYLRILNRILHRFKPGVGAGIYTNAAAFAAKNYARVAAPFTPEQEAERRALMAEIAHPPSTAIWLDYDFLRIEQAPDAFTPGEPVSMTEKIHGSCCIVGIVGGERVVTTKRSAKDGITLPEDDRRYWRAARQERLHDKLAVYAAETGVTDLLLFGEVFGPMVQDLTYGVVSGEIGYRAFDLYVRQQWGDREPDGPPFTFLPVDEFFAAMARLAIPRVPEVYRGPYTAEMVARHTHGQSTLAHHVREGVVIKPLAERIVPDLGRLVLKSISAQYLARTGATDNE